MIPELRIWIKSRKKMAQVCMIDYDIQEVDFAGNQGSWPEWSDVEIMMFTEMHDEKGIRIYEGDLVRVTPRAGEGEPFVGAIEFDQEHGRFSLRLKDEGLWGITDLQNEVIGNIHENPELLK